MDPSTLAGIGWGVTSASWLISPVLSRVINKCFDALGLDPKFLSRKKTLDKKLEDLQTTLLPQLIILTDAAQKSPHRCELEAWLQKLKSAYYEAEHLLGLVEYTRLEKKANSSFPSNSKFNFLYNIKLNYIVLKERKKNLLKSLEKLEKIVDDEASKLITLLKLSTTSVNNSNLRPNDQPSEQRNETISDYGALKVIGRDKDRDQIINLLRAEFPESSGCNSKCYSVIGIWGMGGSGKTTLAQHVYTCLEKAHLNIKDVKKDENFDLVIWVHVSQNFSVRSIWEAIWVAAFKNPCPKFNSIQGIHTELKEKLKGQRFFLVLDDAWCDEDVLEPQFQQLFAPLQDAKKGSKILVTTRIEGVAKALGATNLIALRQLDDNEFLDLFISQALCNMKDAEKHLEGKLIQIGKQIAEKLHHSPLAATIVAAQLRKELDPDSWKKKLDQNLLNETMGALLLSYQNLPPPLQRCFAFCSLFPKGHKFHPNQLVQLWIAEGFIETDDTNRHVRDIGNEYMLELISRSFIQVGKNEWGVTLYSIHDLLHDLAEKVSNGECFRIKGGVKMEIPMNTRHLFVESNMFKQYVREICKLKDLRTIIFAGYLIEKNLDIVFTKSKKLYVVDLCLCTIDKFPESVIYLENLRYLDYGWNRMDFQKISSRLYQLKFLHGIMRYSHGEEYSDLEIPNIGRLTSLQERSFKNQIGKLKLRFGPEQLEHLRGLYGELKIYDLHIVKSGEVAGRAKLSEKKGLCTLKLCWDRNESGFFRKRVPDFLCQFLGGIEGQPRDRDAEILEKLCPPPQIKNLTISCYSGKSCPTWFSEYNKNTTHLKKLLLDNCQFLEALPETNNLIHLQSLTINRLDRLKSWASLPPYLVEFRLTDCKSLVFGLEEDLKIMISTKSREQSPTDNEDEYFFGSYLHKRKQWDDICQLKEVNGELYLPPTLEKLRIRSCFIADKIFASSLQGHTLLTHLELCDIFPLTCIPGEVLCSLTNLQVLKIKYCLMLTSISGWETLSSLEEIEIEGCPSLTIEMPAVASSCFLKKLRMQSCNLSDDMFKMLNSLETLYIFNCPTIKSPDFSNSKSLCSLTLSHCENLVSLGALNELTNLEILDVGGCMKLQCSSDASKFPPVKVLTISELSTLQFISRDGLSSLVSLRVQFSEEEYCTEEEYREMLPQLSSLEEIKFEYCTMKSLPNLLSLCSPTKLQIIGCKMLTSLSELPPSVQSILFAYCSDEFKRSCEDKNHPNWQKISHIPDKDIYTWL